MDTVNIAGVEILRIGKWNGREYSGNDLDAMVASFAALRGTYEPPAKLGHNAEQQLLASDGLPAAGWVANLYRKGSTLVADFKDVPKSIAELIKAGAYKKRSAEIWFNTKFGEITYPAVLKAVSWLGADAPAVSGLSDVFEMYADDRGQVTIAVLALDDWSYDARRAAVWDELNEKYPYQYTDDGYGMISVSPDNDGPSPSIRDLYDDRVVVNDQDGDSLWSIPYTMADSGEVTLGEPAPVMVTYQPIPAAADLAKAPSIHEAVQALIDRLGKEAAGKKGVGDAKTYLKEVARKLKAMKFDGDVEEEAANSRQEGSDVDETKVRAALGIGSDADIVAEIVKLKAEHVSLADHERLTGEVAELRRVNAERDADDAVDQAVRLGKVVPANREWARAYCLSDRQGFDTYVKSTPKLVHLDREIGHANADEGPDVTDAEREVGKRMGVSEERLADKRPLEVRLAEQRKGA